MIYKPYNAVSKTFYAGKNIDVLTARAIELNGLSEPRWLTFAQARTLGAHVRKGEKGTLILFASERKGEDGKEYKTVKRYRVFHASQIEGLPD